MWKKFSFSIIRGEIHLLNYPFEVIYLTIFSLKIFSLFLYDFIVVYIWYNPSIFSSNDLESPTVSCSKEDSSPKKCQMKFFCLMDSCHSNFLSNLRLKWGTKNGAKESSDPDKIRIEHSIAYLGLFCPGAKQPITYLSIFIGDIVTCAYLT